MAQFDVYKNMSRKTAQEIPYIIDIQHELLSHLGTRLVVPLYRSFPSVKKLNPTFVINNQTLVLGSNLMSTVSIDVLSHKVTSLTGHRDEIIASIDFLITGF